MIINKKLQIFKNCISEKNFIFDQKTYDEVDELERLRRENLMLKRQLKEQEMTVELLKKVRELEGM